MSKILQKGETGFGILIEEDAGFLDIKEGSANLLTEGVLDLTKIKPFEPIYINCILQKWGTENKNGRIYPKEVLVPQVEEYRKLVETNSAISQADHPDCINASESMICTKNGWKNFKDISENEEILTLNTNTNQIEIQKIEKKIYQKYNGLMYKFSNKFNIELTVTPNHRFLLEDNKGVRFNMTAEEIYNDVGDIFSSGKNKILKTAEWIGEYNDYFILNGVSNDFLGKRIKRELRKKYISPIKIKSEDWFAFMGIYLSEGHSSGVKSKLERKSRGFDVCITQKEKNKKEKILNLLNLLPFKFWINEHIDGKTQYHISDARLYKYLYPLGSSSEKYIPLEMKQASSDLLKIFFNWFQMGDGRSVKSKHTNWSNKESVFSTSEKLINDLHEILIKIGGSGNITTYQPKDRKIVDEKIVVFEDGTQEIIKEERIIKSINSKLQYNLNISKTKYICLDKRTIQIEKIIFNDYIACVRVPNGNFYVMVKGKSHWTGNSSVVSLADIAHLIKKMWWGSGEDENVLYGQLRLIVTPGFLKYGIASVIGDKILLYLSLGIRLGISSRGVGTLKEVNGKHIVQSDFELICFDLVASPSTPGAYLFPDKNEMELGGGSFTEAHILDKTFLNEEQSKIIKAINKFLL